jgi:hypothetical protein
MDRSVRLAVSSAEPPGNPGTAGDMKQSRLRVWRMLSFVNVIDQERRIKGNTNAR